MLKLGLIGAGTMGAWYAQVFAEYGGAELVCVCDLDLGRARTLAGKFGGKPYADYAEMIDTENLDAVAVATPDRHHRASAVACLDAGLHVLCEKPFATSIEDARAMSDAVRTSGKELMVNFGNRHRPQAKKLRELLHDDPVVGEIASIYIELNERIVKTQTLAWAGDTSPVWFLLSHCIDYVRFLTGLEITEIHGYETRKILKSRGCDGSDSAIFVGTLSNGGNIFLGSSWAYPDDYIFDLDFPLRVVGTEGLIESQMHPHDLLVHVGAGAAVNYSYDYENYRGNRENWWTQSTRYFLHCIETGAHPTPDVTDGIACLKVLLAMDESIRSRKPVRISEQ